MASRPPTWSGASSSSTTAGRSPGLIADIAAEAGHEELRALAECCSAVGRRLAGASHDDRLAASYPFLTMLSVATCGWLMERQGRAAGDDAFGQMKKACTRFYLDQVVPEALGLRAAATATSDVLYAMPVAAFARVVPTYGRFRRNSSQRLRVQCEPMRLPRCLMGNGQAGTMLPDWAANGRGWFPDTQPAIEKTTWTIYTSRAGAASGPRVIMVHGGAQGSKAAGERNFAAQKPLADDGLAIGDPRPARPR